MNDIRDEIAKLIDVVACKMFDCESQKCLGKAIREVREADFFKLDGIRVVSGLDGEYYGAIIHIYAGGDMFDDVTINTLEKIVKWDIDEKSGSCALTFDKCVIISTWVENVRRMKRV